MKAILTGIMGALLLAAFSGCTRNDAGADKADAYRKEIEEVRQKRLARLMRDDGWLTLAGLFWLKEGENSVGSDSSNAVALPPGKAPKLLGSLWLGKGSVRFAAAPGADVKKGDSLVTGSIAMRPDAEGEPTILTHDAVSFYVIKRGEQLGVRVKDKENPARRNFQGLDYFPTDPKWRVEARFEPYRPPKTLEILNKVGTIEKDSCPGALIFTVGGKECRLDAVIEAGSENQLFIMFSDETSGQETYANGRQLYTDLPGPDGTVTLDFNQAFNWPCVFTDFATCPIPPRQNRLPVRVEAGEKMYRSHAAASSS